MSGPDKKKLDKMIWQLREGWGESTRVDAARDLGWIGTEAAEEAVPELTNALLHDKSENVRLEAAIALQWIGSKASTAIPALAKALQEDESEKVRERAAIVLQGLCNHVKGVVHIIDIASKKDKSIHVREAAENSLLKIAEKLGYDTKEQLLKACKKQNK